MTFVYIIYSKSQDKFYIGQTCDIEKRLNEHNSGFYHNAYTAKANDWNIFHLIECNSKQQAIAIEQYIKRMKSKKYILALKSYPELSLKLKNSCAD